MSHNKTNRTWSSYRWDILYTRHGSRLATWWRHQMETFSTLLAICAGNSPVTDKFLSQRPVTRSFDVFFDLRLNERMSKQWWGWRFETPSCSLWRHCNVYPAELWYTEHAGLCTKCQLFNPISLIYKEVPAVTQRRIARVFVHLLHSIGTHIATLFSCNGFICRLHDKHTIYPAWERERERERDIKFIGLCGDRGHRGPCSPYKPCNRNLYIGMIIFPHIDNQQSTGYDKPKKKKQLK